MRLWASKVVVIDFNMLEESKTVPALVNSLLGREGMDFWSASPDVLYAILLPAGLDIQPVELQAV